MLGSKKSAKREANVAKRRMADRVRLILSERFPMAFHERRTPKSPLKIGIFDDVVAACPDLTADEIKAAVADYCYGPRYWFAMTEKGPRVDLNGDEAGEVTVDQARRAIDQLLKFKNLPPHYLPKSAVAAAEAAP